VCFRETGALDQLISNSIDFPAFRKVPRDTPGGLRSDLIDHLGQLRFQGRILAQDLVDVVPGSPNGAPPAEARLRRRRVSQLEQMLDDRRQTMPQFETDGLAQILDLLGDVLPIDRQVGARAGGLPQLARLLLRPLDEVLVVKRFRRHRLTSLSTRHATCHDRGRPAML
jgi:hypothetical protein